MALSANTVWEIRTAGADDQGGGFVAGASGTDYSQQDSKNVATGTDDSTTDAVANGTTTITSATANFGTSIVGNVIVLSGGTGALTKGWYHVTARTNATTITVDRTVAAGTGITMNIGGALLSIGMLGGTGLVSENKVWIKSGTYTINSATTNISGGCFLTTTAGIAIEGYGSSRGDLGTKPLLQASGISSFTMITFNVNVAHKVVNLKLDGATLGTSRGILFRSMVANCEGVNFTNSAFVGNVGTLVACINCLATGCSTQAPFVSANCFGCVAHDNTVTAFSMSVSATRCFFCIADSNSGASSDGFSITGASSDSGLFVNCVAYNNGRDGFRLEGVRGGAVINCIAEDNAGWGFNGVNVDSLMLFNNAGFSNTSGEVTFGSGSHNDNLNFVTGTGSFFTNAASRNFSLNNTASAGAAARAAGIPGVFPSSFGTTGYLDIGAAQHQDAGGGGGAFSAAYMG